MAIDKTTMDRAFSSVSGANVQRAATEKAEVVKAGAAGKVPAVRVEAQAPQQIAKPTLVKGAETQGVTLPAAVAVSEARKLDVVGLAGQLGKGQAEIKVHLSAGQKIADAKIPEGMYAVMTVAVKDNGAVDFEKSSMHFVNAQGQKVKLDRERSLFDVVGASLSKDGQVMVDVAVSPFDVDVTEKLLGVDKVPSQLKICWH